MKSWNDVKVFGEAIRLREEDAERIEIFFPKGSSKRNSVVLRAYFENEHYKKEVTVELLFKDDGVHLEENDDYYDGENNELDSLG